MELLFLRPVLPFVNHEVDPLRPRISHVFVTIHETTMKSELRYQNLHALKLTPSQRSVPVHGRSVLGDYQLLNNPTPAPPRAVDQIPKPCPFLDEMGTCGVSVGYSKLPSLKVFADSFPQVFLVVSSLLARTIFATQYCYVFALGKRTDVHEFVFRLQPPQTQMSKSSAS